MTHFRRGRAMVTVVLLLPAAAGAQAEHVLRKTSLRAASNEWQEPHERVTGPDRAHPLANQARRARAGALTNGVQKKDAQRDPVGNGIGIGALAGALGGVGLTGLAATQCNGKCDDPSLSVFLVSTMALGTGIGALCGFLIDRAR